MCDFAKVCYILSSAEEGLNFEGFVGAESGNEVIGIDDSSWADWDNSKHSRSTQRKQDAPVPFVWLPAC